MDFLTPTVKFIGGNVKEFFNLSLDLSKLLHEQYRGTYDIHVSCNTDSSRIYELPTTCQTA